MFEPRRFPQVTPERLQIRFIFMGLFNITSRQRLAGGSIQSDCGSFVNSFLEPIDNSATSSTSRLVPLTLINPLLLLIETLFVAIDHC